MARKDSPPREDEIAKLPRWAQVAFAARCARRVQPLFQANWSEAPKEHIEAVDRAITLAEQAARADETNISAAAEATITVSTRSTATATAVAAAARAAAAAACAAAAAEATTTVSAAARAVSAAARAATAVADAAAANDAAATARAIAAAAAAAVWNAILSAIWADCDLLQAIAVQEKWNDQTPVPADIFGPLWPNGDPEGWPSRQVPIVTDIAPEPQITLKICSFLGEFALEDEVAEQLFRLIRALNTYHIAAGGNGLVVDDWQTFVSADVLEEVLT